MGVADFLIVWLLGAILNQTGGPEFHFGMTSPIFQCGRPKLTNYTIRFFKKTTTHIYLFFVSRQWWANSI